MEKRQKSDQALVRRSSVSHDKEVGILPVVEDEDRAAVLGKKASSTESGAERAKKANQPKATMDKSNESKEDSKSSEQSDGKPDKKEGRKLQKLLKMLRGEVKEKKSTKLLDKAEKVAKNIFKKRKSDGTAEGNQAGSSDLNGQCLALFGLPSF